MPTVHLPLRKWMKFEAAERATSEDLRKKYGIVSFGGTYPISPTSLVVVVEFETEEASLDWDLVHS